MKKVLRKFVNILNHIGLHVITIRGWKHMQNQALKLDEMRESQRQAAIDLEIISFMLQRNAEGSNFQIEQFLKLRNEGKAAFRQDLIALVLNNFKKEGVFIEVGACDGLATSNTFLLEKEFGWQGLLIEPAKVWQADLISNRKAELDFRCAWKEDGITVRFAEKSSPGRSGIVETSSDLTPVRTDYEVETVTLRKIISEKKFLNKVNFLSVDTEGSEYEVLLGFPFESCRPDFICVEHNFETDKRFRVRVFLEEQGYINFMEAFSYVDDWYVAGDKVNGIK
jgi:FkbM family methyltransferase